MFASLQDTVIKSNYNAKRLFEICVFCDTNRNFNDFYKFKHQLKLKCSIFFVLFRSSNANDFFLDLMVNVHQIPLNIRFYLLNRIVLKKNKHSKHYFIERFFFNFFFHLSQRIVLTFFSKIRFFKLRQ